MAPAGCIAKGFSCLNNGETINYDNFLSHFTINSKLRVDPRYCEEAFSKFIRINREALEYLEITLSPDTKRKGCYILTTGKYAGVIPVISPVTGTHGGYLQVTSRYSGQNRETEENWIEILPLLAQTFKPDYRAEWKIDKELPMQAPILMECVKFMRAFAEAIKRPWQKFHTEHLYEPVPKAGTDWERYAAESFDPRNALRFFNHNNSLTTDHHEWRQLTYVLQLCLEEVRQYSLKHSVSRIFNPDVLYRLKKYAQENPQQKVDFFPVKRYDPVHIKLLKPIANNILLRQNRVKCAWRVNYEEFFERYMQYLCRQAAQRLGGTMKGNERLRIKCVNGFRPSWSQGAQEPDILIRTENDTIVLDAKYKSHMLNLKARTESLVDTFRQDFHQILAYNNIYCKNRPVGFLLYPTTMPTVGSERETIISRTLEYDTQRGVGKLHLLGIPIDREAIEPAIAKIAALCREGMGQSAE